MTEWEPTHSPPPPISLLRHGIFLEEQRSRGGAVAGGMDRGSSNRGARSFGNRFLFIDHILVIPPPRTPDCPVSCIFSVKYWPGLR